MACEQFRERHAAHLPLCMEHTHQEITGPAKHSVIQRKPWIGRMIIQKHPQHNNQKYTLKLTTNIATCVTIQALKIIFSGMSNRC